MKLGLKYFESGYGGLNLLSINSGSWDLPKNFPTELSKVFKCAGIADNDGKTLAVAFKYISEGLLILLAKRVEVRGKATQGIQALWIFIPAGAAITSLEILELIDKTGHLFDNPLNFASEDRFRNVAQPLYCREISSSEDSVVGSGNMEGGDPAVVLCVPPVSMGLIFEKGFLPPYKDYGLIVINLYGINTTPAPNLDIISVSAQKPIQTTEESEQQHEDNSTSSTEDDPSSSPLPSESTDSDPEPLKNPSLGVDSDNQNNYDTPPPPPPPIPEIHNEETIGLNITPPPFNPPSEPDTTSSQTEFNPIKQDKTEFIPPVVEEFNDYEGSKRKKSNQKLILTFVIILLVAGGIFGWFYYDKIYRPSIIDEEAERVYPIVNVFIRSSKISGIESNKIESVPAGSEVICYEHDGEWAKVKYIPEDDPDHPIEGYMSCAYLLDKYDMVLLNSIFGDRNASKELATSRVRRGLIEYYDDNGLIGDLDPEEAEDAGIRYSSDKWQVFLHHGLSKPNELLYKRAYDPYSKYSDLAVIIEKRSSGRKKLLYFTYDDNETPHLRVEAEYYGTNIRDFRAGYAYLYVEDQYGRQYQFPLRE